VVLGAGVGLGADAGFPDRPGPCLGEAGQPLVPGGVVRGGCQRGGQGRQLGGHELAGGVQLGHQPVGGSGLLEVVVRGLVAGGVPAAQGGEGRVDRCDGGGVRGVVGQVADGGVDGGGDVVL
jgi:hypothetical protein